MTGTARDSDTSLALKRTAFDDGHRYEDDFIVMWRGLPVGRILRQPGIPMGRPNWFWGINFDQRPQPAGHRGMAADLGAAKAQFRAIWHEIEPTISDEDIMRCRRHLAEVDARFKGRRLR